ncbi:tail fiber domain-containing protein, partial [Leclercia adecarboxylata]|uniref:hypothetical protein n=1 Tax=Leclercia adecarboxylata TaxID=83655 RepID=UPI00234E2EFF
DRLVVISYRYRDSFLDSGAKTFVGLLAENVESVIPGAVGGDHDVTHRQPVVLPDGSHLIDDHGGQVFDEHVEHVPMNLDMMQILALNTRAHQQKSRRIRMLERELAVLAERLEAAGY